MNFWKTSTIHNQAMLNTVYREIGVWTESSRSGTLFMVTFGARPDDLPVVADPLTNTLYLSNEYYPRGTGGWLRQARTIRLYDAAGAPLTEAIPWQRTLAIPPHTGDRLSVVFDDGTRQLTRNVDLQRDVVILPDTLALVEGTAVAVASTATPTPPLVTPTSTQVPIVVMTLPATAAAVPTPIPLILMPTEVPAAPDVLILYDSRSLTVYNGTDVRLDLSTLVLSGGGKTLKRMQPHSQGRGFAILKRTSHVFVTVAERE